MKKEIILALCEILNIKPEWLYYDSSKKGHGLKKKRTKEKIIKILGQILAKLGYKNNFVADTLIYKKNDDDIAITILSEETKKQIILKSSRIAIY